MNELICPVCQWGPPETLWSSVENTLPIEEGSYLGVVTGSPWGNVQHRPITREVHFTGEEWTDGECRTLTVTHWMPKPRPPSESSPAPIPEALIGWRR